MQLTPHFHLNEFIASDTALRLGIDNTPTPEAMIAIAQIAFALEFMREQAWMHMHPVLITSGYRCPALNKAVGGTPTSSHLTGFAADIAVPAVGSSLQAAIDIEDVLADTHTGVPFPFDQLIHEPGRGIVHLSVDPKHGYRRQILTQEGGPGTPLRPGL